jgi:CRISPR type IV-associated protein Csf3
VCLADEFKKRRGQYRRLRKREWTPMRIEARLRAPVVFIDPIAFDGILSTAVVKDIMGAEFYDGQGGDRTHAGVVPLPLGIKCDREIWFWRASYGLLGISCEPGVCRWKKRWDDDHHRIVDFKGKRERVSRKVGKYKAYDMPLIFYPVPSLVFYAVGDLRETTRLLGYVTHLGKKSSQGFGEVREWRIVEDAEAWGKYLLRALPIIKYQRKPADSWYMRRTNFHPPYWDGTRSVDCWVPSMKDLIYVRN